MRNPAATLILLSAGLLAGCPAANDSTSSKQDKLGGGILSALRPAPVTIAEGTTFPLLLDTALSSATSRSGDLVVARLAEDIRVGEKVVIPVGTEVRGRVTAAVPSGRVKTRARLAFDFDTIVLKGEHAIGTRVVDITAGDTHNKDAATIGIGVGAGALLGAIIGGKKGAGVGGLIGGASGTGVMLTNTGKEVRLGTGSRLTVRLVREARL